MVTIKQIALRCGVSLSTVSKALNGASDVSEKTIQLVRRTAEEMGYMPNAAARTLKTRRSCMLGILFAAAAEQGLTHEFFSRILNSFRIQAEELGYDICFISSRLGNRKIGYAEHARYRGCDGVMVVVGAECDEESVRELLGSGIPVVCVDSVCTDCSCILSDNEQGMAALVSYVIAQGHRRIAFIHGEDSFVTRSRIGSFLNCCSRYGIEIPNEYLVQGLYHNPDSVTDPTRRLLSLPEPPTCILFPDDVAYLGGVEEIGRIGLSIPRDISATGYDGTAIGQAFHPHLTTILQNAEEMGASAAKELVRIIDVEDHSDIRRILVPSMLLPGETVRPFSL